MKKVTGSEHEREKVKESKRTRQKTGALVVRMCESFVCVCDWQAK